MNLCSSQVKQQKRSFYFERKPSNWGQKFTIALAGDVQEDLHIPLKLMQAKTGDIFLLNFIALFNTETNQSINFKIFKKVLSISHNKIAQYQFKVSNRYFYKTSPMHFQNQHLNKIKQRTTAKPKS